MSAKIINFNLNDLSVPIVFEQSSYLPLVSMQLVFRNSGASASSVPGLSKLAGKLLSEGSKELGSIAFATLLENRAVSIHASVGIETFVISINSLRSEFDFAIKMLKQLLSDPNYSQKAFEKVQTQTIGTLTQKQSDFDFVANNQLKSILFDGTNMAYSTSGTTESVSQIELSDIEAYITSHIGLDNLIAVVGGDISDSDAISMVQSIGSILPRVSVPKLKKIKTLSSSVEKIIPVSTEQAYVYFGAPYDLSYGSEDTYIGKIASFVLGSSGFGSRLMEEIRVKRGLAYSVYANIQLNETNSYLSGHLQTKLESMQEAKTVVQELISEFVKNGIFEDELTAAKKFLLGSEPLRNETLQQRIGIAFGEYYGNRELGSSIEDLDKISSITLDEVNKFIKEHQELSKLSFSIVTNLDDK